MNYNKDILIFWINISCSNRLKMRIEEKRGNNSQDFMLCNWNWWWPWKTCGHRKRYLIWPLVAAWEGGECYLGHFESHSQLAISCCFTIQDWIWGGMWAKETRICKTHRVEDLRVNDNEWQRAKDKFSLNVYDLVAKKKKKTVIITQRKWIIRKVEGKEGRAFRG